MSTIISSALDFLIQATDQTPRAVTLHTRKTPPSDHENSPPITEPSATTKLISICEILKREYIKLLDEKHLPRLDGLYQYNLVGSQPSYTSSDGSNTTEGTENEEARRKEILGALEGNNFPRQTRTPFMEITLSTIRIPHGATSSQKPLVRKLTKSAKRRSKQRAAKARKADALIAT